jgi:hypothetical protein
MIVSEEMVVGMKNAESRKAFLNDWRRWSVMVEVPALDLVVRRASLPDGSYIAAALYKGTARKSEYGENKGKMVNEPRFSLIKSGERYRPDSASISWMSEHLMAIRKNLLEGGK